MTDALSHAIIGLAALAGVAIVTIGVLKGWRDWIALQRLIAEPRQAGAATASGPRIELADLKERVRRLEAIAAGVDL